jgi:hypothetical protein
MYLKNKIKIYKLVKQISYPGRTVPNPIKVLFGSLKIVCCRKEWRKWPCHLFIQKKKIAPPPSLG